LLVPFFFPFLFFFFFFFGLVVFVFFLVFFVFVFFVFVFFCFGRAFQVIPLFPSRSDLVFFPATPLAGPETRESTVISSFRPSPFSFQLANGELLNLKF